MTNVAMKTDFLASEVEILVHWITERDAVRLRKERGLPKPWTTDPLLRDYRWCNVRRMDDRVSVALMANWYPLHGKPETQLVAAVLARLVNWPASLDDITGPQRFDMAHLSLARAKLGHRASMGYKVFTGAYVVPGVPGRNKVDSVCDLAELVASRASGILADSMAATWANLVKIDGLGSFLAGQMVADLAHLSAGEQWQDAATWAPLGPGSARGMNRLMGRPKDKAISQAQFDVELPALIGVLKPLIAGIWEDRRLQAFDTQNCLCEYDKARRLMLGEGQVRSRYDGAGEPQMGLL
jgi:hypothetical protein